MKPMKERKKKKEGEKILGEKLGPRQTPPFFGECGAWAFMPKGWGLLSAFPPARRMVILKMLLKTKVMAYRAVPKESADCSHINRRFAQQAGSAADPWSLGNGLRVVCGAAVATKGRMVVSTGGSRYRLCFRDDGTTVRSGWAATQEGHAG